MPEAMHCVLLFARGGERAGGAGGDVLCATPYTGGCGGWALSLEVVEVIEAMEVIEVLDVLFSSCRGGRVERDEDAGGMPPQMFTAVIVNSSAGNKTTASFSFIKVFPKVLPLSLRC